MAERKLFLVVISPLRAHTTGSREGGSVLAAILVFSFKELPGASVNRRVTSNLARHFIATNYKFTNYLLHIKEIFSISSILLSHTYCDLRVVLREKFMRYSQNHLLLQL